MSFSVITMLWLGEHRMFVIETFIKTESYMSVQHAFHKKFKLENHDLVPSCVTVRKWVKIFRETNATSVRVVGKKRSIQTGKTVSGS